MSRGNGGPAFPEQISTDCAGEKYSINPGMTLRDYFAAHAPIGVADANDAFYRMHGRNAIMLEMLNMLAELRGDYADFMLAERAK